MLFPLFFPWYLCFPVTLASSGVTCCYHKRINLKKCGWGFMLSREVTFGQKSFVQTFPLIAGTRVMSCHNAKEEYGWSGKGETAFPGEVDMLFLLQKSSGLSGKELSIWWSIKDSLENVLCFIRIYSECGSKCVFLTKEKCVEHMKKYRSPWKISLLNVSDMCLLFFCLAS